MVDYVLAKGIALRGIELRGRVSPQLPRPCKLWLSLWWAKRKGQPLRSACVAVARGGCLSIAVVRPHAQYEYAGLLAHSLHSALAHCVCVYWLQSNEGIFNTI